MHGRIITKPFRSALLAMVVLAAILPVAASAQDPAVGGYSGTAPAAVAGTNPPAAGVAGVTDTGTNPGTSTPSAGVAGKKDAGTNAVATPAVAAPSTGTLPFTGLQIAFIVAAGLALLGLGIALRRASEPALPRT